MQCNAKKLVILTCFISFSILLATAYSVNAPAYAEVIVQTSGSGTTDPAAGVYSTTYFQGGSITITAYPSVGWLYNKTQRNGVDVSTTNPDTFTGLGELEVFTIVFTETVKSWHSVESWTIYVDASSSWHSVEAWTFNLSATLASWHNVEYWSFNVACNASWNNVETWTLVLSTWPTTWHDVETWNFSVKSLSYHNVETWNFTVNATSSFKTVESWEFTLTTFLTDWRDVETWNFSVRSFYRGMAWPAHTPFYLNETLTCVGFNDTAYLDAFKLEAGQVTFYNVSMGLGQPVPELIVTSNTANLTFFTIDYLNRIGYYGTYDGFPYGSVQWFMWIYGLIQPGPGNWWSHMYGLNDASGTTPTCSFFEDGAYVAHLVGDDWFFSEPDDRISTHREIPLYGVDYALLEWGHFFRDVEWWTPFYPYTGDEPYIGVSAVPFMFVFGMIGLTSMFGGPIYGAVKMRKHEYARGVIYGLVIFVIGFALFVAWLWS